MSLRVRARRRASQPSPRLRRFAESLWLDEPEWAFPERNEPRAERIRRGPEAWRTQ